MKTFIIISALFLSLSAQARSPLPFVKAELTQFKTHPTLGQITSAEIIMTPNELILSLDKMVVACQFCLGFYNQEQNIRLKIVKRYVDGCGSQITIARQDDRPRDGNLQTLIVRDNRSRKCLDIRPLTEVRYEVVTAGFGGSVQKYQSYFSGSALKR